jgi:hypothetical protein
MVGASGVRQNSPPGTNSRELCLEGINEALDGRGWQGVRTGAVVNEPGYWLLA